MAKKFMHRDMPTKNYAWQAHSLYEYFDEVGMGGIALYGLLTTYDYGTHIVFPSRRTLARRMKVGRNTISEYLTRLEKAKLIKLEKRYGKRNRLPDHIHLLEVKQRGVAVKSHHPKVAVKSSQGGCTTEPGVALKVSRNKKNKIRRTEKEHTVVKKRHDSAYLIEGYKDTVKKQDRFYYKRSIQLFNTLKSKKKVFRKVDINKWSAQFKALHVKDGIEKNEIKRVLIWYLEHIGEKYMFKAYSASAFRKKFDSIAEKMQEKQKDKPQKRRRLSEPPESKYGRTVKA